MSIKFAARPYVLTENSELIRLHHGTDFEGRNFAIDAIDKICNGEVGVEVFKPESSDKP
jgi:hypothetical protein